MYTHKVKNIIHKLVLIYNIYYYKNIKLYLPTQNIQIPDQLV